MQHQTEIAYRQERLAADGRATRRPAPSPRTPHAGRKALHRLHLAW
jgi:hypothetical protein